MANTKRTKRKDVVGESSPHPDSDSGDELPQNEGNGDLVIDSLIHVHEKCDSLMAQIKALNQATGETESTEEGLTFCNSRISYCSNYLSPRKYSSRYSCHPKPGTVPNIKCC